MRCEKSESASEESRECVHKYVTSTYVVLVTPKTSLRLFRRFGKNDVMNVGFDRLNH